MAQKRDRLNVERVRQDGASRVMQLVQGLNKVYQNTDFKVAASPAVHDFYGDKEYNAIQGWVTCDGPGEIYVAFSRDGITYGDTWTMKRGENTTLMGIDIATIRVTHTGADSAYRIWLI